MRLNLYIKPTDKDTANDILISLFGQGAADTFGPTRTKDGAEVLVCSWVMSDEDAETIRTVYPDIIKEVENFNDFGYVE